MQKTVKITRKGQTTIPAEIRRNLGIKIGDEFIVEAVDEKVVFRPVPRLEDCAGMFAGKANVEELKKELDKIREEY